MGARQKSGINELLILICDMQYIEFDILNMIQNNRSGFVNIL